VTSDQEAVDIVRNVQDPQAASKILVDHALARFSTDNLSVMIVRFDPSKLASNTATEIGVESDPKSHEKGAVSEVEMIVGEARRNSAIPRSSTEVADGTAEDANDMIIPEDEEPGPELDPEGGKEAEKILQQNKTETSHNQVTEG
jgi:protein phosphatase PTC1